MPFKLKCHYLWIFFIMSFYISFCQIIIEEIPLCGYPLTKRLNNGKYLIICSSAIYFYDSQIQIIVETKNCASECFWSTAYSQFLEEDDGYIVIFQNGYNYILSENGNLLSNISISNDIPINYYYSIVPYGHSNNEYFYSLIYTDSQRIFFNDYLFNSESKNITFKKSYLYNYNLTISEYISCQLMKNENKKLITCFCSTKKELICSNFDPLNNYTLINELRNHENILLFDLNNYLFILSDVSTKYRDISIILLKNYISDKYFYVFKYNIKENSLIYLLEIKDDFLSLYFFNELQSYYFLSKVKYFPETNQFLVTYFCEKNILCFFIFYLYSSNQEDIINYSLTNSEFNYLEQGNIDFIYSSYLKKYLILYGKSNSCIISSLDSININLNCSYYYNYNKTGCLDNIPKGYYLENSDLKTIDKCHQDCETCDQKEISGNSNCKACNNNKFLDLGNCVLTCENGNFTDYYDNSIIRCKCNNIKCEYCSLESKSNNSCITCNKDLGYYPIIDDINKNKSFIDCYQNLENYFLYKENNSYVFKPCYYLCKICNELGDDINNKCEECISNYILINNNNYTNCYEKCKYYYYFDSKNNYHCTDDNYCPEIYNLLIKNKSKCIDNCNKDDIYKFMYKNECYDHCPEFTEPNINNICINSKITEYLNNFSYVNIIETNEYIEECNIYDFLSNKCKSRNENNEIKGNNINNIKYAISNHTIDSLLDNIVKNGGEDITISEEGIIYQLSSSSNQNNKDYKNISNIKLGKCEQKLKEEYNISQNYSLLILKIDFKIKELSGPIVEYEVYHPETKQKLSLNKCEKDLINISVPAPLGDTEEFMHDPNNEFFNDICSTFTTKEKTDITINDRQNHFIKNNLAFCENNCRYKNYNHNLEKANCECNIKIKIANIYEVNFDSEELKKKFKPKNLVNLKIMKCYKKLFSKQGLKYNIGNYFLLSIIFLYIIGFIFFIFKGFNSLKNKINKMIYKIKKSNKNKEINQQNTKGEEQIIKDKKKINNDKIFNKNKKKKKNEIIINKKKKKKNKNKKKKNI